jgi:hypothetical protein
MHRGLSLSIVMVLLVSSVSMAWAGGSHHHGTESAYWWALGAGVALGTLGGVVKLTRPETITGDRGGQGPCARSLRSHGRARDLLPDPESLGHLLAILGGRAEVTPRSEV